MDKEKLKETIEAIRSKIDRYRGTYDTNETAVRDQLVKPILKPLGWDTEIPENVLPELSTEEGHPDYSLFLDNKRILFIETKNLSTNIKDIKPIKQLAKYAFGEGVDFGILTNGRSWILLRSYEKGTTISDRIIWDTNIVEDNIEKILVRFKTISKENIEHLSDLTKKQDILSETWKTVLQSPEILVDPIAPVIKEQILENYDEFSLEDIKEFLHWKLPETLQRPTFPPPIEPRPPEEKKTVGGVVNPSCATAISIRGKTIKLRYVRDILVETANFLFDDGHLDSSKVPIRSGSKRYIVNKEKKHQDGGDFTVPIRLNCGLYIEGHVGANSAYTYAQKLMREAGLRENELILLG